MKKNYRAQIRALAPLLVLVGLVLVIGVLRPGFLNWDTCCYCGHCDFVYCGSRVHFRGAALGSIDLSIQAICSFASVIVAAMLPGYGYAAFPIAVAMGLVTGTISGLFHGVGTQSLHLS